MACVLVYDYLFGGGLRCGGKLKSTIFRHKTQLKSAVERLKVKRGVTTKRELIAPKSTQSVVLPRYVRVNTIKCTMADVVAHFESEGMMFRRRCESWGDIMELIESGGFVLDPHVDDVLVFRSSLDLHRHELYTLGHIILQGKVWGERDVLYGMCLLLTMVCVVERRVVCRPSCWLRRLVRWCLMRVLLRGIRRATWHL